MWRREWLTRVVAAVTGGVLREVPREVPSAGLAGEFRAGSNSG
jgi:hypothetical protein